MVCRRFITSLAIEFGPVTLFFLGATFADFFVGVTLLMIGTGLSLAVSQIRDKRIPLFSLIASSFILLFGALTLFYKDPVWVVFEYTLYNGLFGIVLLVGSFFGKSYLKPLFESMFCVSDTGWHILSRRWGLFFILIAVSNEVVWRLYGEAAWVEYRLAATIAMCIFGFSQFYTSRCHRLDEASPWGLRTK